MKNKVKSIPFCACEYAPDSLILIQKEEPPRIEPYQIPLVITVFDHAGGRILTKDEIDLSVSEVNKGFLRDLSEVSDIMPEFRDIAAHIGYQFVVEDVRRIHTQRAEFTNTTQMYVPAEGGALVVDPIHKANWYIGQIPFAGGFAIFPTNGAVGSYRDASFIRRDSFGDGDNGGGIIIHEEGHRMGFLYHTFQGGCSVENDHVADTPAIASSSGGCPIGRLACDGGKANVENYMDYVERTTCAKMFTKGQKERYDAIRLGIRSDLFQTGGNQPPLCSIVSPATGTTVPLGQIVWIDIEATDDKAVSKVEVYFNGVLVISNLSKPYTFGFRPFQAGEYHVQAKAYDHDGLMTGSNIVTIIFGQAKAPVDLIEMVNDANKTLEFTSSFGTRII